MDPNEIGKAIEAMSEVRATAGTAGVAGVALALVFALTKISKLPSIDRLLSARKWVRVVVAIVLGVLAGGLKALVSNQPWTSVAWGAAMGVFGGLGAVGLDQFLTWLKPSRQQQSDIQVGIEHVLAAKDAEVVSRVEALKSELDNAKTIEDPAARRRALADWGRRHLGVRP